MRVKVCGMKYEENIQEVLAAKPDYLGFIFYEASKRNYTADKLPFIPSGVKKVGVFVNEDLDVLLSKAAQYKLDVVQLHGDESVEYSKQVKQEGYQVFKVFSVKDSLPLQKMETYNSSAVDAFLFDTKGKERGGNGVLFDWSALEAYQLDIPIVLSGGIGIDNTDALKVIQEKQLPILAVDINSRFETAPGIKNAKEIKKFIKAIAKN